MTSEDVGRRSIPAGWYRDPRAPEVAVRYWDGHRWTHHHQPMPTESETSRAIQTPASGPGGVAEPSKLISCPTCGQQVSLSAKACPSCGMPRSAASRIPLAALLLSGLACVSTLTANPWVCVPVTAVACFVSYRAVRAARRQPHFPGSRRLAVASGLLAGLAAVVCVVLIFVVVPGQKEAADKAVQSDLTAASSAQRALFEQEGRYASDVYDLKVANGWTVGDWDNYWGSINFTEWEGETPGYCMWAQSASRHSFRFDSVRGIGEGTCEDTAQFRDTGPAPVESDPPEGTTAQTAQTDAAFCELVGPFVSRAMDFEAAARAGDAERFAKAANRLANASDAWIDGQDELLQIPAYASALETYEFHLTRAMGTLSPKEWNSFRKETGSHLTRGVVRRTSYTCPDYAAVKGL